MYILVVDDDQFANDIVQFTLSKEGYEVETTDNTRGALQMIQKREPDLLILDVGMPHQDGFEFSTRLRDEGYNIPLIFVTALDGMDSKSKGFHNGADDYICKPFNLQELVWRVKAVLRRSYKNGKVDNQTVHAGLFELFPSDLRVVVDNRKITLTHTEMLVLRSLMVSAGQVVSRNQILSAVWKFDESNSNIVDVYIRRLRRKLEPDTRHPRHIICIRGLGYKFIGK